MHGIELLSGGDLHSSNTVSKYINAWYYQTRCMRMYTYIYIFMRICRSLRLPFANGRWVTHSHEIGSMHGYIRRIARRVQHLAQIDSQIHLASARQIGLPEIGFIQG